MMRVMAMKKTSESTHVREYRKALAWHLYSVMQIIQQSVEMPEIRRGLPDASVRLLHRAAYEVSTAITDGVEPQIPEHILEGLVEQYTGEC